MRYARFVLACAASALAAVSALAQMVVGSNIPGYHATFGLDTNKTDFLWSAQFITSSVPGNVAWPGDVPSFTFQVFAKGDRPVKADATVELVEYGTRGRPGDIWVPDMFLIRKHGRTPVVLDLPAGGFQDYVVTPEVPETFGGYALVLDLGGDLGRQFLCAFVRVRKPVPSDVLYPQLALDVNDPAVLSRLGGYPNRIGIGYKLTTDADFGPWWDNLAQTLQGYHDARLPITLEIGGGSFYGEHQPLGRPRPWLSDEGVMLDTKFDLAWLPRYDADFRIFVKRIVAEFGWPRGPINGIKLWNEPWNGISISGWGADDERYREIFRVMCEATREACAESGNTVLIGGCDSSSNTFDKLFADGSDDWLQYLDFCSIHYQGMQPPSTVKAWVDRQHPNGRVRIWDTESWVANCDDRVAAVVAVNLSTGHDRAVGIYGGSICTEWHSTGRTIKERDENGAIRDKRIHINDTWAAGAAVAATSYFIGQRPFRELLFKNGLPWVMVFDGLPGPGGEPDPEDGTVVVVGDIGEEFGANHLLFRTARGFAERRNKAALRAELDALPPDADPEVRASLIRKIETPESLSGAEMAIKASGKRFALYDFYGNPVPPRWGTIRVPLDGRGFFLRGNGQPGSFARLLDAIRASKVTGIEPIATVAYDLTAPVGTNPELLLDLTCVLNRDVKGTLSVTLGGLQLENAVQRLAIGANETRRIALRVAGGAPSPDNTYPLEVVFDAGRDGRVVFTEDLHVNFIARRPIVVDGRLDDWEGVLPQSVRDTGKGAVTLAEAAWLPFKKYDDSIQDGFATGFLAYDDAGFHFAAKIADSTPDPDGLPRFAAFDEDEYFYPATSYSERFERTQILPIVNSDPAGERVPLHWPEGVRRYSYRKDPVLPCGNAPRRDNVQIAFNVLPAEEKDCYPCPPGTMPGYIGYRDTDYEFGLNTVGPAYGGGTEIWRLRVPGMPSKHFYPRSPASPFDGPAQGAMAVSREGGTRIVEATLSWSEIPEVKKALDEGRPVKFSFRVNDNGSNALLELSRDRSVAKINLSFHADWTEHWANELAFGWEK
jgi:hypothetical protein